MKNLNNTNMFSKNVESALKKEFLEARKDPFFVEYLRKIKQKDYI